MCVQFFARRLFYTTGPANMIGHDGVVSVNEDFPIGTILCYDKDDNLYVYHAMVDHPKSASCWPVPTTKGVPLYRDYWKHIDCGPETPYGASIRNAQSVNIIECR